MKLRSSKILPGFHDKMFAKWKSSCSYLILQCQLVCKAFVVVVIDKAADDVNASFLQLVENFFRFTRQINDFIFLEQIHERLWVPDNVPVHPAFMFAECFE